MIKLYAVAPFWKRDMTTALFFEHMHRHADYALDYGIDLQTIAVGSENHRSENLAGSHIYVEHANQPLGAKFNAGFLKAKELGADYVMTMGSDTFFSFFAWEILEMALDSGFDLFGFLDLFMYDLQSRRAVYWKGYTGPREGDIIGPLRLASSSLLDQLGWEPYDGTLSRNLDASMREKMKLRKYTFHAVTGGRMASIVSVKEADSITAMASFNDAEPVDPAEVLMVLSQFY